MIVFVSINFLNVFGNSNTATVQAATNSTINFQARLLTSSGNTVPDGNYHVEFKLFDASSSSGSSQGSCAGDSNCLWTETRTTGDLVRVVNGYLSVNLGSVTAFPSTIDWDQEHWLSINIGGKAAGASWDGQMTPRLKLTGVPYAFRAGKLVDRDGANEGVLEWDTLTAARSVLIPDEDGTLCIQGSANCGFADSADLTLQGAYDGGNTIATTDGNDIDITLANTTTDPNFTIDIATGSTGEFQIEANGTDVLQIGSAGQLQLDVQGSSGGILLGTDALLYRGGADLLRTPDSLTVDGSVTSTGILNANATGKTAITIADSGAQDSGITIGGDTNLYRSAADTLKTDDNFVSDGTLTVNGAGDSFVAGSLGLNVANPQGALSIPNSTWITGVDSAGTGFVNILQVNSDDQIQLGAALSIDGGIVLPTDGGQLTLVDLPISAATIGTPESYTFRIGSTNVMTVYGESDGAGGAQNLRVAIGTSISPSYPLDVDGDINISSGSVYRVNGSQISTSDLSNSSSITLLGPTITKDELTNSGTLGFDWADSEVSNTLTLGSSSSVDWTALNNYPSACSAGEAVSTIGDTLTCTAFNTDTSITLQDTYNAGNTITTTDGRDIDITLADTTTDANFTIDIATGSTGRFAVQAAGTDTFSIGATGDALFQNSADSATAFQILNAAGANIMTADTTAQQVAIGPDAVPANGALTVGTDTTAATGGLYFGTDTNLYRSAANKLKTDDSLDAVGYLVAYKGTAAEVYIGDLGGSSAGISFGLGGGDTNIYRSAPSFLKTDDNLIVSQRAVIGTSSSIDDAALTVGPIGSNIPGIIIQRADASTEDFIHGQDVTGNDYFSISSAGQLQLPVSGSTAGILLGGDANLYRSNPDQLTTDDSFITGGDITVQGGNLTVGVPSTTDGNLILANSTSSRQVILQGLNPSGTGDATIQIPSIAGGSTDTICLETLANCGGGGVTTVGTIDSQTKSSDGAVISGSSIYLQTADATNPGLVSTGTQTFAGDKTFNGSVTLAASQSLTLTGGATGTRPGSPSEGMLYYDTTTDSLLVYSNGKWQADRSTATKIVAMGTATGCTGTSPVASSNPDSADYTVTSCISAETDINSAISALPAGGGTVYLKEGTYIIDGAITVPSNVTLTGSGAGTVLTLKDAINAGINAISASGSDRTTISNLKLDGNKANNSSGTQNGISIPNSGSATAPGVTIDNVDIENFRDRGVDAGSPLFATITNTKSMSNDNVGFYFVSAQDSTISGNVAEGNAAYGFVLHGSRTAFQNNVARNNTSTGIGGGPIGASCTDCTITGNVSTGNGGPGLDIDGNHTTISGNNFSGNTGDGINWRGENSVISNNTVNSNTAHGIKLDNLATDNTIANNRIDDNGGSGGSNGIYLGQLSSRNKIMNNFITDTAGTGCAIKFSTTNAPSDIYLSDNIYSGTGATSICTAPADTVWANQSTAADGGQLLTKTADSTAAFQIQNASGDELFTVDSTNSNITLLGNNSGEVQAWGTTTVLPDSLTEAPAVTSNGYVYYIGGWDGVASSDTVYYAKLNANGTVGSWSTATTFPIPTDGGTAVSANGYIYYLGGWDEDGAGYSNSVYYAKQNADGTLGSWSTTSTLPAARYDGTSVVANGYVYMMGGHVGGAAQTSVYYAKLNADGTLGSWSTSANVLPAGRAAHTSVAVNGYVYVIGGSSTTVYYATLDSDGDVGSWSTTTALGTTVTEAVSVAANGYIYVMGGTGASAVYYSKVNAAGTIGSWSTAANSLPANRAEAGSIIANGYAYVIAGYNGSTPQNTVYYSSLPRVQLSGSLDLIGLSNGNLANGENGGMGGELTAGNTNIVGNLQVQGNANFAQSMNINNNLGVGGQLSLPTQGSSGGILIGGDTQLYRTSTNMFGLGNGDSLRAYSSSGSQFFTIQSAASSVYMDARNSGGDDWVLVNKVTSDANQRYILKTSGEMQWGNGTDAPDIVLTRSGAGSITLQPTVGDDSDTAFRVLDSGGGVALQVNTNNSSVGIGAATTATDKLYVQSGGLDLITANSTGSSNNLLQLQNDGNNVLVVDNLGHLYAGGSSTATTATTSGTGTNTTTVNLTGAAFANGDVIFIDNAGQDYYTRITAGGGTATLTVSPAVTFENTRTVTKYDVQNIGSDSSGVPSSNDNRFFQGYFTGGIVTGAGSSTYSDGMIVLQGDTNLYRSGAGSLKTDGAFVAAGDITALNSTFTSTGATADTATYQALVSGDTIPRYRVNADGKIWWGDGTLSPGDTNLYRSAANTLKTDDSFHIQTASDSSNAFQIQNASGLSLFNVNSSADTISFGGGLNWGTTISNLAQWNLNEASWNGTTDEVVDSVGGYDGTANIGTGATTASGHLNNAGTFNGSNGVTLPDDVLDLSGDWTVSMWVNLDDTTGTNPRTFAMVDSTNDLNIQLGYTNSTTYPYIRLGTGASGGTVENTGNSLSTTAWHHVVYVSEGGVWTIYVDNTPYSTSSGGPGANSTYSAIGSGGSSSWGTHGDIDEVQVYNGALSDSQVSTLYNGGTGTESTTGGSGYVADTNLYRPAADFLWTDDQFGATGKIMTNDFFLAEGNTDTMLYLNRTGSTSRKAQIAFQDDGVTTWILGQDGGGTGDQDFFLWDNEASAKVFGVDSNGDFGIGIAGDASYRLDVEDSQASTYVARINNTNTGTSADGLLINLGVSTGSRGNGNHYIDFGAAGTVAGNIRGSGTNVQYQTSGADYAEYFLAADLGNKPQAGEIVSLASVDNAVDKARSQNKAIVGVVSEHPGFLGNGPICQIDDEDCEANYSETNVIVGMTGQLPVKVSSDNGEISIGDPITVGDTDGVGVKATGSGQIVGYAMEAFNGEGEATIQVFINPGYYSPPVGEQMQGGDSTFASLHAQTISTDELTAGTATVDNLTVVGTATIATLHVTGGATFDGNITVDGHIVASGGQPAVEVLSTAGANGEASVSGNDTAGTLTIQTGDDPTTGDLLKLIFNNQYGNPPKFIFSPANANGAELDIFRDETTGDYAILKSLSDPQPNTTYKYDYFIIQSD